MKCFIVILLFASACTCNSYFERLDSITPEAPCSAAGGICTIAEDCPAGRLTKQKGLCPDQRNAGIECCYGVSMKETRCRELGGSCIAPEQFCNENLAVSKATDCPDHYTCCIVVK